MDGSHVHASIEGKRLGFVQAPRIAPGAQKKSELPVWIRKIIASWRPKRVDSLKNGALVSFVESCSQDYGSAAMDFTGKDVDESLDEPTQRALLDGAVCKQTSRIVRRAVKDGCVPITFCAGRIPSLGSLSGHGMGRAETGTLCIDDASSVCLLWLDLFANMDSRIRGYSEYLTRCPAAFLLHEPFPGIPRDFPGFEWIRPWLSIKRAAVIGLRNPSDNEIQFLEESKVQYCTLDNLGSRGAQDCITTALMAVNPRNDLPVHLSINIFALDLKAESDARPTMAGNIPVPDVLLILESVLRTGKLGAVDFLEVDQIDPEDVLRATEVINDILKRVVTKVKRETAPKSFDF